MVKIFPNPVFVVIAQNARHRRSDRITVSQTSCFRYGCRVGQSGISSARLGRLEQTIWKLTITCENYRSTDDRNARTSSLQYPLLMSFGVLVHYVLWQRFMAWRPVCLIVISDLVACSFKNVIIYLLYSLHYGTSTFIPLVVAHLVQPLL